MNLAIVPMDGARPLAPRVNAYTTRFWEALAAGRLETTRCAACQRASFPPRQFCPGCGGRQLQWFELRGTGTLYAQTTVHAAPSMFPVPYTLAIVDLDEGIRVVTRLLHEGTVPPLDSRVRLVVTRFTDGCLFAAVTAT
jgi:uncharacterized OB-fold protein